MTEQKRFLFSKLAELTSEETLPVTVPSVAFSKSENSLIFADIFGLPKLIPFRPWNREKSSAARMLIGPEEADFAVWDYRLRDYINTYLVSTGS